MNRFINSFSFAINGILLAFKMNLNIKSHLLIAILVILAALFLNITHTDFVLVIILIAMVFGAEMINSALEEVVNLLVSEHRIEAKIAKDVSAGMVLVISTAAFICGLIIFLPYLLLK
jgi:diacylglycerol kinase